MMTARILDSGRKHPSADLIPKPRAVSFLVRDLEDCIIVMIALPDPHQRSVAKRPRFLYPYIYMQRRSQLSSRIQAFSRSCRRRDRESRDFRCG